MSIKAQIEQAAVAYYEGNPIMSDSDFDKMVDEAVASGEYVKEVGFGYTPSSNKVTLKSPMLSLNKISNNHDEVRRWVNSVISDFPHAKFYVEPKWDGLSIQTVFEDGELVFAATRGNGTIGENVLEMAKHVSELTDMGRGMGSGTLNGEIVVTYDDLRLINENGGDYVNTRNTAAGLLRRTDNFDFAKYLSFRPHDGQFNDTFDNADGVISTLETLAKGRDSFTTAIDGAVIKVVADGDIREELGYTSSAPRWAVAFKFEARSQDTTLRSIRWTVGRTGRLIPSAIFDPVNFDNETTISTLHNVEWMESHQLHVGDTVTIESAGDVIPYFAGVRGKHNLSGDSLGAPSSCPLCDGSVRRDGVHLVCVENCNIEAKLIYFFRAFDTKGIGPSMVSALFDHKIIERKADMIDVLSDVLTLDESLISMLPGMGEAKANTYRSEINNLILSNSTLESWIVSLGLHGVGWSTAGSIVANYPSLVSIIDMVRSDPHKLTLVDGLGQSVVDTLNGNVESLDALRELHEELNIQPIIPEAREVQEDELWTGKNVVLTGTLPNGMSRGVAAEWLESRGANIQGGVTGKTDILVAGEKAGSKLAKAESLGIQIIRGDEFAQITNEA